MATMKLPSITNATLTSVAPRGFTADYGQAATTGSTKWTGSEDVYWSEEVEVVASGDRQKRVGGERSDVLVHRTCVVDSALPVTFAIGDTITVSRNGSTITGTIQSMLYTEASGLPGVVRLILEDA